MDIDENSEEIEDVKKIIPEVYKDMVQPAAREMGKLFALIPRVMRAALTPLDIWSAEKDYKLEETKRILEKKLENVNSDNIVTPESYVAVPALQAISYSMNSDELRNLYANLLVKSMIKDTKWQVHPSYLEIIKQITPDEAKLLKILSLSNRTSYPLIDVKIVNADKSYSILAHNFTNLAVGVCENIDNTYMYLDNLERLKIIDLPSNVKIANADIYKPLEEYPEIKETLEQQLPEGSKWEIDYKQFDVTNYGKKFIEICVKDVED